jgi:hypothetical protein
VPLLNITKAALDRLRPIEDGWYLMKIILAKVEPSKAKDSLNFIFHFELDDGRTIDGPADCLMNNKVQQMFWPAFLPLCASVQGLTLNEYTEKYPTGQSGVDTDKWVGKKVQGLIGHEVYEGNIQIRVKGFLPPGANTETPF